MADEVDLYEKLLDAQDSILVTPTKWLIMLRPYVTNRPTADQVTNPIGSDGNLIDLSAKGFKSPGRLDKKAGVDLAPDRKTSGVEGYGALSERRQYLTSESFSIDLTTQEYRKLNLELFTGADLSKVESSGVQGFAADKLVDPTLLAYEMFAIAYDNTGEGAIYPWFQYHKVQMGKVGKLAGAMDNPFGVAATLKALAVGNKLYRFGCGGAGFAAIADRTGFAEPSTTSGSGATSGTTSGSTSSGTTSGTTSGS